MTAPTAAATSLAITTFHDEFGPQFLAVAAVGPSHEITTQGFAIENVGGGVVATNRTPWGESAPPGAHLFVAASGRRLEEMTTVWVGWTDPVGIHAISAYHEHPFVIPVASADAVVQPPVVAASGRLEVFVFHAEPAGASLLRHEAHGVANKPIALRTDKLLSTPSMPALFAAAPVPGVRDRDVAIVGWVEVMKTSCRVGVAVAPSSAAASPATVDVADILPIRGRLGVEMKPSLEPAAERPGTVEVAFVGEQLEHGGYVTVVAALTVATGRVQLTVTPLDVPRLPRLVSAFVRLPDQIGRTTPSTYALREDGVLVYRGVTSHGARTGVPPSYDFPIELDGFEPQVDASGTIALAPIVWDRP